jgi:hypothetical protein
MDKTELIAEYGKYYFRGREISRRQYQKIRYGNWSDLQPDVITKKLLNKELRKQRKEGFEIVYEEILAKPLGQYCLGIAQEKAANKMMKVARQMKNEGRKLVRSNKNRLCDKDKSF